MKDNHGRLLARTLSASCNVILHILFLELFQKEYFFSIPLFLKFLMSHFFQKLLVSHLNILTIQNSILAILKNI